MPPDSECYKVEVIYFINPHLIWVEVRNENVRKNDFIFEQVGVYGVLPLESSLDIEEEVVKVQKCDDWILAANTLMKNVFSESTEVWFSPTFIDKRSSIFDDNIHKYGEFVLKLKNGEYKKLSKLLIKANIAHFDIGEFHNQLSSGHLKTKLSPRKTQEVVKEIENYYIKADRRKTIWKKSIEKQTSTFHMVQGLENDLSALTASNLEKHNNKILNKVLEDKIRDFELCKDIEDESLGRGFKSNRKTNETKQLNASKSEKLKSPEINQSYNDIKSFLVANAKTKDQTVPIAVSKTPNNDKKVLKDSILSKKLHMISQQQNKLNKIDIKEKSHTEEKPVNEEHKDLKQETQKLNDYVKKQVKTSKIERKQVIEEKNTSLNKVVYGPPGLNPQHLVVKETKAINDDVNQVSNIEKNSLVNSFPSDNDSELNLDINQQKEFTNFYEKVKCINEGRFENKIEKPQKIDKDSSILESDYPSDRKCTTSLLLKKKLRAYDNLSSHNNNFSSSDTSNKDTSSISDKEFDDSLCNVVEIIDEKYRTVPALKNTTKPNDNLLVTELKNNVNPFKNIDPNISVFVDKLVSPVLMVHTKHNKRIQPVFEMRDVFFNSHIHIVLRNMLVRRPMMLQTVSWNTILRGYSLFTISPPQSGKTLGYLPAVCRLVSDGGSNGSGPICIIVCATAKSVAFVEEMAKMFLGLEDRVLACYAGVDDLYITSTLLNGCDLLISTPSSLIRLIQMDEYGVDLGRLSLFVFDDCERLATTYKDEVKFFLFKIRETLKARTNNELKVQYIVASRVWCDFMEPLAKKAPDTVISIGAFQECILYSKSNTSVSFVKIENKLDTVFEFLKDIDGSKKTVIVCKSDDEVELLEKALKRSQHTVFSCNNEMTVHELYNLSVSWSEHKTPLVGPILICCDGNLTHMNITDAHNLIHFSLPQLFSMFCRRFCVLNDNYPSLFKTDKENVKIKILLDDSNVEQLPKIINFIKRCTHNMPNILDELCDNISKEKEMVKAKNFIPICDKLLIFGCCPDVFNCQDRHAIFAEYDTPKEWVPKDGIITFRILHYHTAILYSARLLSNTVNGATTKYAPTYRSLTIKMGMYYSKESNRRLHGIPKIGDVCAVSIKLNFYARCQVVKILSQYESGNPNNVLVNLIDEEKYDIAKDIYLYHLPDEFRNIETHVMLVRLANMTPKDKDITFSDLAKGQLKKITDNDDLFIKGRVSLVIGNCVFVDTLEACQELTSLNETVVKHNLKKELLDNHAELNPDHLNTIKNLCKSSGLILKKEIKVIEAQDPVKNLPKGTWAYLENGVLSTVYLASTQNPDKFFVRLTKFESCMNFLMQDIKKYVDSYIFTEDCNVKEGDLVLAECPEDSMYERARIDHINGDKTKCFFVDQGDWKEILLKKLIPLTEKLINQLPFQAIECRLIGIQSPGENWSDFSNNCFIDNCSEDNNGDLKQLYIKHFTKETAEFTNGYKYGVALIDTNSDTDVVINQLMIDLNLARVNFEEKEFLDNLLTESEQTGKQIIEEDDKEDDWEKTSNVTQDSSVIENTMQLMVPRSESDGQVIRSVPLVDSDEDNFDKWDVNMDREILSTIIPGLKATKPEDASSSKTPENKKIKEFTSDVAETTSAMEELDSNDLNLKIFRGVTKKTSAIEKIDSDDFNLADNVPENKKIKEIMSDVTEKTSVIEKLDFDDLNLADNVPEDNEIKEIISDVAEKISAIKELDSGDLNLEDKVLEHTKLKETIRDVTKKTSAIEELDSDDFNLENKVPENTKLKEIMSYVAKKSSAIQELDSDDLTSSEASPVHTTRPDKSRTEEDQKRRPKLLWRQNKNIIMIKIQLIAVENYNLEIGDRSIKFSANVNDTDYEFDIELYGVINKNKSSHFKTGLYIMLKLVKVLNSTWISLTKRFDTKTFISYDVESVDTSSEDEEIHKNTLKNIVETIHDHETDSDDDEFLDDVNFAYGKH